MFKNKPNKCYKTEDGEIWASRSVAVVGVVFVDTKEDLYVLLTKRSSDMSDFPNRWCLPCGYLDYNETLEQATVREICEETSLNIYDLKNVFKFPCCNIDSDTNANRQNVSVTSIFYINTRTELPKIFPSKEAPIVEWCSISYSVLRARQLVFNHHDLIRSCWNIVEDFNLKIDE